MNAFSDPEGWEARLRQQSLVTRSARGRGEEISVTSSIAVVDARFQLGLLDMLSNPIFLAVERQTEQGLTYLIYEAIAPRPTHFQELGMNVATPTIIRREMLQTIDQSWGRSDESWIDIVAIPTHHRMDVNDSQVEFSKTRLGALVGAKTHILSRDAVDQFLSIKNGISIADLLGFNLPLKVNMQNLIRYHSACLGFTGSGKSNFTSHLIREAMKSEPDLRVVIFDIAGEYFIHLADTFAKEGVVYSSEPFETVEQFLNSQIIPETLEEKLESDKIENIVRSVIAEGRLQLIEAGEDVALTLGHILNKLAGVGDRAGALQATVTRERLKAIMTQEELKEDTPISTLKGQAREEIKTLIEEEAANAPAKSGLKGDLTAISGYFESSLEDNGNGMARREIGEKWMRAATQNKEEEPYSKRFRRRRIGEKGIARFGTDSICRHILIDSRVKGEIDAYRLRIDWDEYLAPDAMFEKVPNRLTAVPKRLNLHGLRIEMSGLRGGWDDDRMLALRRDIELLLPPIGRVEKFNVALVAPEFPKFSGKVKASFLNKSIYFFSSRLERDGTIRYRMRSRHRQEKRWSERRSELSCGPVEFCLHFYYREKSKYDDPADFSAVIGSLEHWAGIKLYRDGLRVKPYGDVGNDWIELDKLRVNDPSVYPGNSQIFGYVKISKANNPDLIDTTTREGLVKNEAYNDLLTFLRNSVKGFSDVRREIEGKRKRRALAPRAKRARPVTQRVEIVQETLLDFGRQYPEIFYNRLEDEINECYRQGLPNAALILSRKLIENLFYNILESKYPRQKPTWWDIDKNRPQHFGQMLANLELKKIEFVHDQRTLLLKLLELVKPFMREANLKAHRLMNYVERREELAGLKIPEIVQVGVKLADKVRSTR